ncbi:DNA polymerase III subunit delta [Paraferrimonas sp. SM1919]|uniref:DNA polymerase III subunit delta n=1 Tax=Paraferrimonas sp. SM1919 TaxID=2662263 RepID=UPI0013D56AC1|nr:DNA polymerase III subunit delta [Paraferrimonas sp. SM1919]
MRLYPNQLVQQLQQLPQVVLIFGDEPFLVEDCRQHILNLAHKADFEERLSFSTENQFNWYTLEQEWQSLSLFSSKRIIELDIHNAKPGKEGTTELLKLVELKNPDNLLILHGPKLGADQLKAKWFKSLESLGLYIPCATPEGPQWVNWLNQRVNKYQINLTADAQHMLMSMYEGNLLALEQALQLIKLLQNSQQVTVGMLQSWLQDQSRFSVFQWLDALLMDKQSRALHMLGQLKAQGVSPQILLWNLLQELVRLQQLSLLQQQGKLNASQWNALRIWDKRKSLYLNCLSRISLEQINTMLGHAHQLEMNFKFSGKESWPQLAQLALWFDSKAFHKLPWKDF